MRIIAGDPGTPWERVRVFLDGQELAYCLGADTETGRAVCDVRKNGAPTSQPPVVRTGIITFALDERYALRWHGTLEQLVELYALRWRIEAHHRQLVADLLNATETP